MEYRSLGTTGVELSALSFGASSLGQEFRSVDLSEAVAAVHAALDAGINFFDTSPYYGRGMSEVLLGVALRDVARDRYYLGTKLGRYDVDKFDFSAERVVESVDVSLHRLGVEHLDFVHCHDIEFVSLDTIVDETLPALRELRDAGKVRFVGVSGYPMEAFRRILQATTLDSVLSYSSYTLQNRALRSAASAFAESGVGIINSAPFDMRLLTNAGPPDWHPAAPEIVSACAEAATLCRSQGQDIAKLALQFSVRQPTFATCVAGTANPARISEWVRWLEDPLDEELLAQVEACLRPILNVGRVVGLPENN